MGMYGKMAAVEPTQLAAMESWDYDEMMGVLESDVAVDLDKTWQVAFSLIEALGSPGSMESALPVGEELVYGPAMSLSPDLVREIAVQLAAADDADLCAAFDALSPDEMYPGVWDEAGAREWALDKFKEAMQLFQRAAVHGHSIVFAVT